MIKKYNIETFFTPAKMQHRRAATTESQPVTQRSQVAAHEPMPVETLLNAMSRPSRGRNVPVTINEESEEQQSFSVTELEPKELGSNVEFEAAYSRKASDDFLTMAGAGDDSNFSLEQGRPS